jgi:LemA protein
MAESALIIVMPLLLWGVFLFNRLVKDRNRVRAAWSDIDVQLTRRHELVPRLVEAVKAYAGHEQATLAAITELRSQSEAARHLADKAEVEEQLTAGVQKLIALAEAYPDLKASQNFLDLQRELVDIEDFLQYARRFYNGAVHILGTRIETVPDNIIANLFGFEPAEYFVAEHRDAPRVSL